MTKKRVKPGKPSLLSIADWDGADQLGRRVGDLQMEITSAQATAKDNIDEIKATMATAIKPLTVEIDTITRSLEAFAVNNKKDLGKHKSRKLNFCTVGWRLSSSITIKKATIELIKKVFSKKKAKTLMIVKESADKNALAKLKDEQLASVKARRKVTDDFFVEPILPDAVDY